MLDVDDDTCPPPPPSKCLETRDSISSIDSDVSLSFDRDGAASKEEAAHLADVSSDSGASDGDGGKDSGCETTSSPTEPPEFTPPDDDLAARIVQQVETYFSDAAIAKDAFLLKHVRRNKEGYVSLKLISSFKRVKHLTKDWRVVAFALARSTRLQVNDAGTKLRRLAPLPAHDETTPSRTVIATRLPPPATVESVAELFGACGEISLVRVLRPGNPVPSDVRQLLNKQPMLLAAGGTTVCALIEFATSAGARAALQLSTDTGLKVHALNESTTKKKTTSTAAAAAASKRTSTFRCSPPGGVEPAAWLQRRLSATSTEANFLYLPRRVSYAGNGRDVVDVLHPFVPRRLSHGVATPPHSAVYTPGSFQRRLSANATNFVPRTPGNVTCQGQADNVLRMPKGPDGTKGFRARAIYS